MRVGIVYPVKPSGQKAILKTISVLIVADLLKDLKKRVIFLE